MSELLSNIWFRTQYRYLLINVTVGIIAGIVAGYVVYSVAVNFLDFDFLFGPYGSPDRSSLFPALNVEAGDARWTAILKGAGNTLSVVAFSIILASLVGLLVGIARLIGNPVISQLGRIYVEVFRNLPLLVIMFFFAFATFQELPRISEGVNLAGVLYISNRGAAIIWPVVGNSLWWVWLLIVFLGVVAAVVIRRRQMSKEEATGRSYHPNRWGFVTFLGIAAIGYVALIFPVAISFPEVTISQAGFYSYTGGNQLGLAYVSALLSLTLYFSAFIAEIVRGSIQAISHGQTEAAQSLGLSAYQRLSLVILPQALRIMIPSLNNEYQNTNKDSSLAHAIGYGEMVLIMNRIVNNAGNLLQSYIVIFIIFLVTNLIISLVMNFVNRNVQIK